MTNSSDFGEGVDLITLNDGQKYVFQLNWQTRDVYIWSWPELGRIQTLRWPIKEHSTQWGITSNPSTGKIFVTTGNYGIHECSAKV